MILGKVFDRFARYSPVTVMMRGLLEYVFPPRRLDELFRLHAVRQYEDELLFSTTVHTLALVVTGGRSSVNAAYLANREEFTVSVTSLYNKLKGVETQVSQALVRDSSARLTPVVEALRLHRPPLLAGYRVKIIDGNHLAATEHRLPETRVLHSAPLPGQALVVLDPQLRLVVDVFPCEDAHAQERSLLEEVLPTFGKDDLALCDRNFCCNRLVFGLRDREAAFLLRQHASTLSHKRLVGKRRRIGRCTTGMVYEQELQIRNPHEPDTQRQVMSLRRITIELDEPTRDGEQVLHLVTNVPPEKAGAIVLAELYLRRWDIEQAFQEIEQALRSEVNTLCYPQAALLAFCLALLTFNVLSTLKSGLSAAHHDPALVMEMSGYYLAEEIAAIYGGMMIAIPRAHWTRQFAHATPAEMAACLRTLAGQADVTRFRKRQRGPKKPPPKRTGGLREKHVSTKRLLNQRRASATVQMSH